MWVIKYDIRENSITAVPMEKVKAALHELLNL